MYSTWFFLCLIIIILIFLLVYTRKDLEALIISGFIIIAYFLLKLVIYIINFINSEDLMSNLGSGFLTFIKYVTACLLFTLVFVFIYPYIKGDRHWQHSCQQRPPFVPCFSEIKPFIYLVIYDNIKLILIKKVEKCHI